MLVKKFLSYLESQKCPTYPDDPRAIASNDENAMNSKVFAVPGGHSKVRFKILVQCTRYCGRDLLTISCVSKLIKISPGLRGEAFEHFNAANLKSQRSWNVYYGAIDPEEPTEFRLSAALFEGSWNKKTFNEVVHGEIVHMNDQFSQCLANVLEFLELKDSEYRDRHASFSSQFSTLSVYFPKDSLNHNFIYDLTERAASHLGKRKYKSMCTLYANGSVKFKDVGEDNLIMEGAVECDLGFIEVKLRFYRGDEVVFPANPGQPLEEIPQVHLCLKTELGVFSLLDNDPREKRSKVLEYALKSLYCGLDKRNRQQIVGATIDSALNVARTGFNNLTEYLNQSLASLSTEAPSLPAERLKEPEIAIPHLDWAQAIKDKVPDRVWDRYLIPYKISAENAFVKASDLQKIKIEEIKEANEPKIKEFFVSLAKEDVYFQRLPLDALYMRGGEVVLVPNFDPGDLSRPTSAKKYTARIDFSLSEAIQLSRSGYQPLLSSSSLYCIDLSNLSVTQLDDPSLEIQPGSKLYYNTLNSVPVALRLLSDKKVASVGRLMSLQHKNLARVYGYTNKMKYMIRERGETTLEQVPIDKYSFSSLLDILQQVAEGMEYLHSHGEYHFRLRPSNVLFATDETPLVADYGIYSRSTSFALSKDQFTDPDIIARSKKANKAKADVWSFGLLMHYVLVGKILFERYCRGRESWDREKFLLEVGCKLRRPIIPASFERKYPRIVLLIRSCLYPEANNRPTFTSILERFGELDSVEK